MGIGLTGVGVLFDQEGIHPLGQGQSRDIAGIGREFPGPEFKPQSVFNDQVGLAGPLDVAGGGLVSVNF